MRYLLPAAFLILSACSTWAGDAKKAPVREWKDNTGTFAVRAALVDHDPAVNTLRLRLENGDVVELAIRRLSEEDREYLDTFKLVTKKNANAVNIAGLPWFASIHDAKQAAAGKSTPGDDKPIMCFRGLGDLRGFM